MNVALRYRTSLAMPIVTATRLTILLKAIGGATVWTTLIDGDIHYRKGLRSGSYIIDYSEDAGVTWEELASYDPREDIIEINIDRPGGVTGYRHLIRDGAYVIDQVLTATGFAGVEGTDWEEVISKDGAHEYLPERLIVLEDTIIDEMDSIEGWIKGGSGSVLELNTIEVSSGTASLKLTTNGITYATLEKTVAWDLSSDQAGSLRMQVFRHNENTTVIIVYLFTNQNDFFKLTYYLTESVYPVNQWSVLFNPDLIVKFGNGDWSNITLIRIRVNENASFVTQASFDILKWGIVRSKAIIISFDGGYTSQYEKAYKLMKARRMVGTQYITSGSINTVGRMTTAQLIEQNDAGWDIANHSATHSDFKNLTVAQIETEINDCKNFLNGLGLTRASLHVAYPVGDVFDADMLSALTSTGVKTGRMGLDSNRGNYEIGWPFQINSEGLTSRTLIQAKEAIDKYLSIGNIPHIYFHMLVDNLPLGLNDWLVSDFIAILDYIELLGLQTLTIDEYYRLYSGAITVYHK